MILYIDKPEIPPASLLTSTPIQIPQTHRLTARRAHCKYTFYVLVSWVIDKHARPS